MARDRPPPYDKGEGYRSAGACPPQTFSCLKQDGQDKQDFQDEAAGRLRTGLEDLNVYRNSSRNTEKRSERP